MSDYAKIILDFVEYELWCNFRVLDFLEELSEEERNRDFGFGLRTAHQTMVHIAKVMQGWSQCVGPIIEEPTWLDYDQPASLQDVRRMLQSMNECFPAAAKASIDQGLLGERRRLNQLFHVVTHGNHHRGQLLNMITLMGYRQPFEGGDFGGWSSTSRGE